MHVGMIHACRVLQLTFNTAMRNSSASRLRFFEKNVLPKYKTNENESNSIDNN